MSSNDTEKTQDLSKRRLVTVTWDVTTGFERQEVLTTDSFTSAVDALYELFDAGAGDVTITRTIEAGDD